MVNHLAAMLVVWDQCDAERSTFCSGTRAAYELTGSHLLTYYPHRLNSRWYSYWKMRKKIFVKFNWKTSGFSLKELLCFAVSLEKKHILSQQTGIKDVLIINIRLLSPQTRSLLKKYPVVSHGQIKLRLDQWSMDANILFWPLGWFYPWHTCPYSLKYVHFLETDCKNCILLCITVYNSTSIRHECDRCKQLKPLVRKWGRLELHCSQINDLVIIIG